MTTSYERQDQKPEEDPEVPEKLTWDRFPGSFVRRSTGPLIFIVALLLLIILGIVF